LPEREEFEFLRSKGFRIKTQKMAGVLSQGIAFPLAILPQKKKGKYEVDEDVTEILGITQFNKDLDEPVQKKSKNKFVSYLMRYKIIRRLFLKQKRKYNFPSFLSKTDQTRIQNIPHILKDKETRFLAIEKLDGTSFTAYLRKENKSLFKKQSYEFGVCSRNLQLPEDDSVYWKVAKSYQVKAVLEHIIGDNEFVAIQGEILAPKVQGNKYKVTEPDLYVFDLIFSNAIMDYEGSKELLKSLGMQWCPLVQADYTLPNTVEEMLTFATGKSKLYNTAREGLVIRDAYNKISFKAVSPDFLIKNNE
jgi:hypothetical protein